MLKTAAIVLALLVSGIVGSQSAYAGGSMRTPPQRLGKIQRGGTIKHFPHRQQNDLGGIKKVAAKKLGNA